MFKHFYIELEKIRQHYLAEIIHLLVPLKFWINIQQFIELLLCAKHWVGFISCSAETFALKSVSVGEAWAFYNLFRRFSCVASVENNCPEGPMYRKDKKSTRVDLGPCQTLTCNILETLRTSLVSLAFRLDFLLENKKIGLDGLWGPSHHSSASWSETKCKSLSTPIFYDCTRYFMARRTTWRLSGKPWNQHQLDWLSHPPHLIFYPSSISALKQLNTRWWWHHGLLPAVKDALVPVMAHLSQTASSI